MKKEEGNYAPKFVHEEFNQKLWREMAELNISVNSEKGKQLEAMRQEEVRQKIREGELSWTPVTYEGIRKIGFRYIQPDPYDPWDKFKIIEKRKAVCTYSVTPHAFDMEGLSDDAANLFNLISHGVATRERWIEKAQRDYFDVDKAYEELRRNNLLVESDLGHVRPNLVSVQHIFYHES